jgi:O-antigen ligase
LVPERSLLDACALLALALAVATARPLLPQRTMAVAAFLVALVGGIGLLQSLSWPPAVCGFLAPQLAADWQQAARLLKMDTGFLPLSLVPTISWQVALHWLAVAAAAAAALLVGRERPPRRLLLAAFLMLGAFEVVYGAETWFDHQDQIWDIEVGRGTGRLRGTFVNSNHTAMFLCFATTTTFAGLWWAVQRIRFRGSVERRVMLVAIPALTFLLLFVGLAFTGSRGGLVAGVLALLFQITLLTVPQRRLKTGILALGGLASGLAGVMWFSMERGFGRLLSTSALDVAWSSRWTTWEATWDLFLQSPLTGSGLGTFRQAFPAVQPPELLGSWAHAHNDILELLVTVGILGTVIMSLALLAASRCLWTLFRRGKRSEDRALALAGAGALAAALLHSMVDFGLTIPANAFILAILLGLAGGAPTRTEEG